MAASNKATYAWNVKEKWIQFLLKYSTSIKCNVFMVHVLKCIHLPILYIHYINPFYGWNRNCASFFFLHTTIYVTGLLTTIYYHFWNIYCNMLPSLPFIRVNMEVNMEDIQTSLYKLCYKTSSNLQMHIVCLH